MGRVDLKCGSVGVPTVRLEWHDWLLIGCVGVQLGVLALGRWLWYDGRAICRARLAQLAVLAQAEGGTLRRGASRPSVPGSTAVRS